MRKLIHLTILLLFFAAAPLPAGQEAAVKPPAKSEAPSYTVRPAASKIAIDGNLDERAWREATVMKILYEYVPGDNIPAPVDTDFLITFDADSLYLAFRCLDPEPSKIRAHLMDRDATDTLIQDDHVTVMLDSFNDERRGFQFRVNPLGVQADANFSEMEGYEDFSWDAIWSAAAKITDWGYGVEIAIPFNQLRFPRGTAPQTWGVSAERSYPRSVRHRMASHKRLRNLACLLCQFNKVTGFQGMRTGLNIEADPTLTANRTDTRDEFPAGPMARGKVKADPGLTLRWGVTPNLILNAALNPDFSQVEADVVELDVNRRFTIRYPEKRPFFLEGADFFLTPVEAVFTRTVADPAGGVKFTGKMGRDAFGFFGTYDRLTNLIFPSNQGSSASSLDSDVAGGVFRYRRDIGRNSALGALYTGRVGDKYRNHVFGADGFFLLSPTKTLSFQYLRSDTIYPLATAAAFGQKTSGFGGGALNLSFAHRSREWVYTLEYEDKSPGFRADFGYVPRVDFRLGDASITRIVWGKPGGWFTMLQFGLQGQVAYDYDGELTDSMITAFASYQGPLQSTLMGGIIRLRELYAGRAYNQTQAMVRGEIKPRGGLRFSMMTLLGDAVDYQENRPAGQFFLAPLAELGLGRHLNLTLQYTFQRLATGGEKIYAANLSQARIIYNFSARMFIRAIVQYLDLDRNIGLFSFPAPPRTKTFFTQFLFSYKLNPQTVLFLGYSDNALGMTGIDLTRTNRTFFVKLGYAWLL